MLRKSHKSRADPSRDNAPVFAALGDQTRLWLSGETLRRGAPLDFAVTHGSKLTRQAVTKHLRILEKTGIVRGQRAGRESLFALDPAPIDELRQYLDHVLEQWDEALNRLKLFVED